jgi:hypothetical protein
MLGEAAFLRKLDHVSINKIVWVGDHDKMLHVVREMVHGQMLKSWLEQQE